MSHPVHLNTYISCIPCLFCYWFALAEFLSDQHTSLIASPSVRVSIFLFTTYICTSLFIYFSFERTCWTFRNVCIHSLKCSSCIFVWQISIECLDFTERVCTIAYGFVKKNHIFAWALEERSLFIFNYAIHFYMGKMSSWHQIVVELFIRQFRLRFV